MLKHHYGSQPQINPLIQSNVQIFALRFDRGLSPDHVIKSQPGLYWDQEKGLNEKQYIIPEPVVWVNY